MPSPDTILAGLSPIGNQWRWLATTWHLLLGALMVALAAGWRPSLRLTGSLLVAPLLSVSLVAWLSGNPFNGTLFAILSALLVAMVVRVADVVVRPASPGWLALALAFVAVGGTYPHFLETHSWTTYVYASPFGTLPCPTLLVVIGGTLIFPNLGSTSWRMVLALAGLLYGGIGVFRLEITLDWSLLLAAGVLGGTVVRDAVEAASLRGASCPSPH